jgi:hypothetical protein
MKIALSEWQSQNKEAIGKLDANRRNAVVKALDFLNRKFNIEEVPSYDNVENEVEEEFDFDENIEFSDDVDLGNIELEDFEIDEELDLGDLELSDFTDFDVDDELELKIGDLVETTNTGPHERIITNIDDMKGTKLYRTDRFDIVGSAYNLSSEIIKLNKVPINYVEDLDAKTIFYKSEQFEKYLLELVNKFTMAYQKAEFVKTFEFHWENGISAQVTIGFGEDDELFNPVTTTLENYFLKSLLMSINTKSSSYFMNQSIYLNNKPITSRITPKDSPTAAWDYDYYKLSLSEFKKR